MTDDQERARLAESAEAEFVLSMAQAAPPDVQQALGMRQARIAGGVVTAMEHDPSGGFWNKALGFGFTEPFDGPALDEVCAFFDQARAPAGVLQLSPRAQPSDWAESFAARGLTPGATWVKFLTPLRALTEVATTLDVRPIEPDSVSEYADVYARGFGLPTEGAFHRWISALPSAVGWQCFGVWDGPTLITAGNLFITGKVAVLGGAATPPEARGRGGQSAVMAARMAAALATGCEWVSTETGAETTEDPNPSLHNMRRLGFDELYVRQNWVYRV